MESDEILTVDEVAALLKIHPKTVYKFLKANELQGHRFGRIWRFKKSDDNETARTVKRFTSVEKGIRGSFVRQSRASQYNVY